MEMVTHQVGDHFHFKDLNYWYRKEKRLLTSRLSNHSPYTTWVSWNDQESKSVMEPSVSIVSFY